MLSKQCIARLSLCLILLGLVAAIPAWAGSAIVGSVAGSKNATVGGQTLFPNTTLFSGDSLQVKDGVAVVALGSTSRVVFAHDTAASFLRDANEITVLLNQGSVSLFQDTNGTPVRMKIGDISVVPVAGFKTLGEVATLNGAVQVTTNEGLLRVEGNGQSINVVKGKTITVVPPAKAPPQEGGKAPSGSAGRCCGGGSSYWQILDTGLAAAGLIVAGVAESRASTASNNASSAAAEAAAAAAASAISAANAAASAAEAAANAVGCALNTLAAQEHIPSPYTPPPPLTCP